VGTNNHPFLEAEFTLNLHTSHTYFTRDKGRLAETSRDHWLNTYYWLLAWEYY